MKESVIICGCSETINKQIEDAEKLGYEVVTISNARNGYTSIAVLMQREKDKR